MSIVFQEVYVTNFLGGEPEKDGYDDEHATPKLVVSVMFIRNSPKCRKFFFALAKWVEVAWIEVN